MTEPAKSPAPTFICPFCGSPTPDQPRCAQCSGPLDPLSRQATQNAMGPWFVRDEQQPFRPGCSYETILTMVARGKITADTILRGPSTSQFWYPAKRVPGVAHRLAGGGVCHSCQQPITTESECPRCHAVFHADPDRQFLGLMPVRALPGSGLPLPDSRPPAPVPTLQAAHSASAVALQQPMPQPPIPLSRNSNHRLEAENAALRRRSGILMGVAAGCALVALGAIWFLASGTWQGTPPASGSSSPPVAQGPTLSSKPEPAPFNTGSASKPSPAPEMQQVQQPPAPSSSPVDPSLPQPSPERPSEPAKNPDSAPKPGEELARLRATRWP